MKKRRRNIQLHFMVNEQERELIQRRMEQQDIRNMGAFLRKMAIDGYIVKLDLSAVQEMVSLLRRCSNNLNQYTKRAHETGSIYAADVDDLHRQFDGLWEAARKILSSLGKL